MTDSSTSHFPQLFSPFRLGHTETPNRIVSTSHGTNMASEGIPTPQLIAYHEAKARGGCGTVMMFGSGAASPLTPIMNNHVNLWDDRANNGLRGAAHAIKQHGALAISQVTSMGRRTNLHADIFGRGPSATSCELSPAIPHVLTIGEIEQITADYAQACATLEDCGFDGADLAFYDDQLPDQFWSPQTNHRRDRYGGALENRLRFSLDVLEAIRGAVGRDFIVGARVSGDDRLPGGLSPEELLEIIQRLDRTEQLDYFTVTGGTISTFRSRGWNIPSAYYGLGTFVSLAGRVRSAVNTPVIVTGRIVTPDQAERILESGAADLVGMTRALIADPDLPTKARNQQPEQIRVCMGSNEGCIDRLYFGLPIGCVQNPVVGREQSWGNLNPATKSRHVVVIGGGPAGMETARVAASRQHQVTLLERDNKLGGAIQIVARASGWESYSQCVTWLKNQLLDLEIDIRLETDATTNLIRALSPDAVVVATGAEPRRPNIAGANLSHVVTVSDILSGSVGPSGRCVILDEIGYTPGAKTADTLSQLGYDVEIVTRQYALGEDIGTTVRAVLYERLLRAGVRITTLHTPVEITTSGVRLMHVLTDEERFIEADTVVLSSSGIGRDALHRELVEGNKYELHLVGDAFAPRHLRHAMVDGARTGRAL